ncbi:nostrin isoform X1 [Nothobranchius furzeri]|uniref:Osteoclast-stimulating factor 1 n=1 Tax=Nothobranchius furzeri TaxID=105023 RepID=A0A9D2Y7Z7_NOTFU|nr:nostrin isoform X1 [Nothobranchius furzeri]KAF7215894.1 transcript variant X1 [Nothobranchius furzeri]
MVKVPGSKSINRCSLKMKDPIGTCSYNQLYQNLKQFSKNGDYFFKELITVFQQRAELELTYSKGLQKLAGKLIRACQGMSRNSTYRAWCHVSDEMYSRADAHRSLGTTFNQEAIVEIRQVLDEHSRRKRPLDSAIERNGKLFTANWNEQLKLKKKLSGLTREHEALFNYVENNKHISTEKEKQKMLHRLTKSAEQQARVDEEYFNINMEGHQMRLKWENTLKSCYQITQELEKQRLEVLCNLLSRYKLHMSSFGQTLKHGQKQIEQAVQRVDMEKDVQTLIDENKAAVDDNKVEFLMTDYLEEDSKSLMSKDRRQQSIRVKLQRLEDNVAKTKKDCEGIEKLMKTYAENPSFSNQKNLEETEELHDECTLKLDLLEATHYKLYSAISECERQSYQRLSRNIFKWKDKDCEHSVVQVTRPVKLRRTPFRSRQSLRASIIYKGPVQILTQPAMEPTPAAADLITPSTASEEKVEIGSSDTGAQSHTADQTAAEPCCVGKCKALYNFTAEHNGELALKEGDLVDVYTKGETGWWFGVLNGQKGHFPSTYVEDLPVLSCIKSSDA